MLEGLEISEIRYSEVLKHTLSSRFDSEFFKKIYLKDDKAIAKNGFNKLVKVTNKINVGFVGAMVKHYRDEGITILQTKNIDAFFITDSDTIKITPHFHNELKKSKIHKKDILIARSGSFGKASIYLDDEVINSSDIIIVEANELLINPYFLVSFLNSKFGINQMIRFASGGLQGHVNLTILEELEVPKINNVFQLEIERLLELAYSQKQQSKEAYKQAENILLKDIGLQCFTPNTEPINIKNLKDSFAISGRLDAEYYQLKYEDIENKILNNTNGFTIIANEFEHIYLKSKKEKIGFNYIEIGDVNVSDGSCNSNYVLTKELPANAKTLVKKGDILISKVRPYRGAVTLINFEKEDLIVSGAFTVLREKETSIFSNEVLKVLLRTKEYKELLLKFNVGTSYPVIKDIDVLKLPIPKISKKVQEDVTLKIQLSSKLKQQSKHLLEVAKIAVEIAIEENEDVAIEYIKNQSIKNG
ncbi:hypothetical protein [Polaribacter ponticola]|uniref:Restriction endonuclease subunit S n=1 Tax=Polaribacter ponticola TaxID=2978475 RepID=A0ABT5S6Q5_9FLAO|nr:hypothetical protein [Polaribacter sp. MSW5]MDD7913779.1 hypothetical protein [Polaribacter sp. MSW5]